MYGDEFDPIAPDVEAFPFDLTNVDLADPFTPDQGMRVEPGDEYYCACGRPVAHARLRGTTRCVCGLAIIVPINREGPR